MKLPASESIWHKGYLKSAIKMLGQFAEHDALNPFMNHIEN